MLDGVEFTFWANGISHVADIIMDVVARSQSGFESLVVSIFVVAEELGIHRFRVDAKKAAVFIITHLLEYHFRTLLNREEAIIVLVGAPMVGQDCLVLLAFFLTVDTENPLHILRVDFQVFRSEAFHTKRDFEIEIVKKHDVCLVKGCLFGERPYIRVIL